MSLKLDNVVAQQVKNVTDYKIINISINANTGDVAIMYESISDSDLVSIETLVVNNPAVFENLKTQAYNFLMNNLGVSGTVS